MKIIPYSTKNVLFVQSLTKKLSYCSAGSELRSWLFHYSVPIMSNFLKLCYLHHFMLLVKGVYNLCKDSVCVGDIKESSVLLKTFVY